MVELFLRGGIFMWPILALAIFGIMVVIERAYTLSKASRVTKRFLPKVLNTLKEEDGVRKAIELCENTPGPIAEIFHAGLSKVGYGMEAVEKAIQSAGTVEMAFLDKGMIWLATVITLAPLLGFMGTVSGMINAFDAIAKVNDMSPAIVAGGISEALLTTLFGLIVAAPLQLCYNLFVARVDSIVVEMEESTMNLLQTLDVINKENCK
ncbi:MAG TPA: MotA/TolQ/ExbB proton channel family protein [Candidatus Marinimicrobia bacterium]|nr:MotA/TolQ/ExbB proton channel family protein [Candidatus Neomarinimicrobiota bacterium]HOU16516.1 MotA/TolQ/ExbB proton channel family protein [Candidatus Neomarinimicrobiota bacterium]HQE94826.1 MotA/TolQ/ExbB proton channel family protein [Candidatus Neomarinimicrobiota bacterium]HQH55756.1 MotA/TolQ/ExbB proton channel family protein [Candidatus Neomarinimicrobiota bacterium]HQK10405.1 MotA/TolQ/ExbB proton channel family protein [Candidatus Neomarinimicrobiota bacterium]